MKKKITSTDLQKAGWVFGVDKGGKVFLKLLNKTLKTQEKRDEFLNLFNKKTN